MKSFFRYIAYIDFYHNHTKIRNVGFLRWKFQNQKHNIEIQIKDIDHIYGSFKIEEKNSKKVLGTIRIDQGIGNYCRQFSSLTTEDKLFLNTEFDQICLNETEGFFIWLDENTYLFVPIDFGFETTDNYSGKQEDSVYSKPEPEYSEPVITDAKTIFSAPAPTDILKSGYSEPVITDNKTTSLPRTENIKILEPLHEDKWQQLNKKFPQVHPFSNPVTFLSIKPEDFIILQKGYQKLVHNSFLLHGFYNYGHLILGKLADEESAPLYLGVPGVYYDREKQAAQMFGFVGFESTEQPVQPGSYGYYMIEVMI